MVPRSKRTDQQTILSLGKHSGKSSKSVRVRGNASVHDSNGVLEIASRSEVSKSASEAARSLSSDSEKTQELALKALVGSEALGVVTSIRADDSDEQADDDILRMQLESAFGKVSEVVPAYDSDKLKFHIEAITSSGPNLVPVAGPEENETTGNVAEAGVASAASVISQDVVHGEHGLGTFQTASSADVVIPDPSLVSPLEKDVEIVSLRSRFDDEFRKKRRRKTGQQHSQERPTSVPRAKQCKVNLTSISETLQHWAMCLLESALLVCCKRSAIAAEDYDFAERVKALEVATKMRLDEIRRKHLLEQSRTPAIELRELERLKNLAVEAEDFELAADLKDQQLAIKQKLQCSADELNRVREERLHAVGIESFKLAAEVRQREVELDMKTRASGNIADSCGGTQEADARVAEVALCFLEQAGPEVVLLTCDFSVADCVGAAGSAAAAIWDAVSEHLHHLQARGEGH